MSNTPPKRFLVNFEPDRETARRLKFLKRKTRWTNKAIISKALQVAETSPAFFNLM